MRPVVVSGSGRVSAALLAALAMSGISAVAGSAAEPPRAPRRGSSPKDLSRVAAAQAKRERRAARNRSRL